MSSRTSWICASLAAVLITTGCGGGDSAPAESTAPAAAPGATKVDPASAGSLNGQIVFEGTPPANDPIKMNSDPVCLREAKGPQNQEFFVVGEGGGLQNVFVYVKEGLGNYTYDPPSGPVTLDQQGCRYRPHVFGVRVGQPLEIINSDPTLHNIHALPKANQEFNTGQPIKGMKYTQTFTAEEVMVPFKCDVHGWMNAYAGVLNHPYFAVSGADGKFSIDSLPAGNYVIEAWHEKLGPQTQNVTVGAKEAKEVNFTFKASS